MKLSKHQWIGVIVAIVVIVIFFFQFFGDVFFSDSSVSEVNQPQFSMNTQDQPDSLTTTDTEVGTGAEAIDGSLVTVHYTGTLEDGTVFDSSVSRGTPFQFILGAGQVIRGWEVGVMGMKVGGKRTLRIPPEMAYGQSGIRNPQTGEVIIPQNATLIFEVELLDVEAVESAQPTQ